MFEIALILILYLINLNLIDAITYLSSTCDQSIVTYPIVNRHPSCNNHHATVRIARDMKGKIDFMHFATVHRMARLCGQPRGSRVILHCRVAMSILVVSSTLLLRTQAAYAQSTIGPARTPIEAVVPRIAPVGGDPLVSDTVWDDTIETHDRKRHRDQSNL